MKHLLIAAVFAVLPMTSYAHHMAPEDLYDAIEDTLISVDSPHVATTEDDPSLVDLIEVPSGMEDIDYVATLVGADIVSLLDAVEEVLVDLERENLVLDYAVTIDYDMDAEEYTIVLYVDLENQ